jgi:hypothetical protein
MLSPRLFFAEDIDSSPRGEGEKTSNHTLNGTNYDSIHSAMLCKLTDLRHFRYPGPLAGVPGSLLYSTATHASISLELSPNRLDNCPVATRHPHAYNLIHRGAILPPPERVLALRCATGSSIPDIYFNTDFRH